MKNIPVIVFILFSCLLNSFAQTPSPTPAETGARNENKSTVVPASTETKLPATKPNAETTSPIYVVKDAPARIPRFESAPVIDGQLNDGIWQSAAVFGDFLQIQPGDNVAPSSPTEVLIGYDAKHLYIAFRIKQDRDKVRATVARRDNILTTITSAFISIPLTTSDRPTSFFGIRWACRRTAPFPKATAKITASIW
jgi:hypothetical protein